MVITSSSLSTFAPDKCAVCQDILGFRGLAVLPCSHLFHELCIRRSLAITGLRCPMCTRATKPAQVRRLILVPTEYHQSDELPACIVPQIMPPASPDSPHPASSQAQQLEIPTENTNHHAIGQQPSAVEQQEQQPMRRWYRHCCCQVKIAVTLATLCILFCLALLNWSAVKNFFIEIPPAHTFTIFMFFIGIIMPCTCVCLIGCIFDLE